MGSVCCQSVHPQAVTPSITPSFAQQTARSLSRTSPPAIPSCRPLRRSPNDVYFPKDRDHPLPVSISDSSSFHCNSALYSDDEYTTDLTKGSSDLPNQTSSFTSSVEGPVERRQRSMGRDQVKFRYKITAAIRASPVVPFQSDSPTTPDSLPSTPSPASPCSPPLRRAVTEIHSSDFTTDSDSFRCNTALFWDLEPTNQANGCFADEAEALPRQTSSLSSRSTMTAPTGQRRLSHNGQLRFRVKSNSARDLPIRAPRRPMTLRSEVVAQRRSQRIGGALQTLRSPRVTPNRMPAGRST